MDNKYLLLLAVVVLIGSIYYVSTASSQISATIIPESNLGIQSYQVLYHEENTIYHMWSEGSYMNGSIPKFVYDAGDYVIVAGLYKDDGPTPFDTKIMILSKDGQVINETIVQTPYTYYGWFNKYEDKVILFMGDWSKLLIAITDGHNIETYSFGTINYNNKPYVLGYKWGEYNGQEGLYVLVRDPNDYNIKAYFIPRSVLSSSNYMYSIITGGQAIYLDTIGNTGDLSNYNSHRLAVLMSSNEALGGILYVQHNSTDYKIFLVYYNPSTGQKDLVIPSFNEELHYAFSIVYGQTSLDTSLAGLILYTATETKNLVVVLTPNGIKYTILDGTYGDMLYYDHTLYSVWKYVPPITTNPEHGTVIYNGTQYTVTCPYTVSFENNETPLLIIQKWEVTESGNELLVQNTSLLAIDPWFETIQGYNISDLISYTVIPYISKVNNNDVVYIALAVGYTKQSTTDASNYAYMFETGSVVPSRDVIIDYYMIAYDLTTDTYQKIKLGQTTGTYIECNAYPPSGPRFWISVRPLSPQIRFSTLPIMQLYTYVYASANNGGYKYDYRSNYYFTDILSPVISEQQPQPTPQPARVTTVKIKPTQYPPQEQPSPETGVPPTGIQAIIPASPGFIATIVVLSIIAAAIGASLIRKKH